MENAVVVKDLSKVFEPGIKLGASVRDFISRRKIDAKRKLIALDNISLTIPKGTIAGIIGENGSGKSTLLKVIGGITEPTSGIVEVNGTIASVLEVGTGFHPELTGRENLEFSSELFGMELRDIRLLEESMVLFSELEEFLDIPVKHYSTGMFMRLAFSVVSHLDADILLLDEVFSVGDSAFQKKCEGRIKDLIRKGKTILLVSHDINAISHLCNYFVRIEKGKIVEAGYSNIVVNHYLNDKVFIPEFKNKKQVYLGEIKYSLERSSWNEVKVKVENSKEIDSEITLKNLSLISEETKVYTDEPIYIELTYKVLLGKVVHPVIVLSYQLLNFSIVCNSRFTDSGKQIEFSRIGKKRLKCTIPANLLNSGFFGISVYFIDEEVKEVLFLENIMVIEINNKLAQLEQLKELGTVIAPLKPKLLWEELNID